MRIKINARAKALAGFSATSNAGFTDLNPAPRGLSLYNRAHYDVTARSIVSVSAIIFWLLQCVTKCYSMKLFILDYSCYRNLFCWKTVLIYYILFSIVLRTSTKWNYLPLKFPSIIIFILFCRHFCWTSIFWLLSFYGHLQNAIINIELFTDIIILSQTICCNFSSFAFLAARIYTMFVYFTIVWFRLILFLLFYCFLSMLYIIVCSVHGIDLVSG